MAKINVGDLVLINPKEIKWLLNAGHSGYFIGTRFKNEDYERDLLALLALATGPEMPVKVNRVNWPNSSAENYNVQIFNINMNIDPKGVKLWQK